VKSVSRGGVVEDKLTFDTERTAVSGSNDTGILWFLLYCYGGPILSAVKFRADSLTNSPPVRKGKAHYCVQRAPLPTGPHPEPD